LGAITFVRNSANVYTCFNDGSTVLQALSFNPLWTSGTSIGPMFTGTAFNKLMSLYTHYYVEALSVHYTPTGGKTEPGSAVMAWRDANDVTLNTFMLLTATNGSITFPLCEEKEFKFFSENPKDPELFYIDPTNDSSALKPLVTPGLLLAATDVTQSSTPKAMGILRFRARIRLYELQGDPAPALYEKDDMIVKMRSERERYREIDRRVAVLRSEMVESKEAKEKVCQTPKTVVSDRELQEDYVHCVSTSSASSGTAQTMVSKNLNQRHV